MNHSNSEKNLTLFSFKKLFNLGLHLNQKKNKASKKDNQILRGKSKWKLSNPVHTSIELTLIAKMLVNLLRAGGKIALINNGPEFRKGLAGAYTSVFEGVNVICYEEDWTPGTFTNPIHGNVVPDLVLFVSVADKDRVKIVSEITNLRIPVINLSSIEYNHALLELEIGQSASKVFFFLHFFLYWIQLNENQDAFFSQTEKDLLFVKKEELKTLFTKWTEAKHKNRSKKDLFSNTRLFFRKTSYFKKRRF